MGYRHSADEILKEAVEVALELGIGALTYSQVGSRLNISDRTVVYYFPTKLDLINAVARSLVGDMMQLLEEAFGDEPLSQKELVSKAWPALTTRSADRVFALYFEIVGLASAHQEPYDVLAPALVAGWVDWLVPRMRGNNADVKRRRALATVAQIDGILLVRHVLGPAAGNDAARESGIIA